MQAKYGLENSKMSEKQFEHGLLRNLIFEFWQDTYCTLLKKLSYCFSSCSNFLQDFVCCVNLLFKINTRFQNFLFF